MFLSEIDICLQDFTNPIGEERLYMEQENSELLSIDTEL